MFQQGTVFDNRYVLNRFIGRGGFAEVWLVTDNLTGLEEVLKIYAPGGGMDEDGLKLFVTELSVVHDLRHTNLLTPKMVGQFEHQPYLILPFCPNGSLTKKVGHCTEEEAWKILEQVASGLAYLHQHSIVHQDIKPDNILLDANNDCVITDFGISLKAQSTLRKSMNTLAFSGTMAYMAPERFSADPHPIPANDVWSLGAMMFELVEGSVPFSERGGGLQKAGADIPEMKASVSDKLKKTIYRMLNPNPADRPAAANLFKPVRAKSSSFKPNWRKIGLWMGIVLVLFAIGFGVYYFANMYEAPIESEQYSEEPESADTSINLQINLAPKKEVIPDNLVLIEGGIMKHYFDGYDQNYNSTYKDIPLDSFYIGKYEVTQKEFMEIMPDNPSVQIGDSLPVTDISFAEAATFCNRLSEKNGYDGFYILHDDSIAFNPNGNGYRLPTEHEWAYAARDRNPKAYKYAAGDNLNEIAWYGPNSKNVLHRVGTKKANKLGIYDMCGNVDELVWEEEKKVVSGRIKGGCFDWYHLPVFTEHSACSGWNCTIGSGIGFRVVLVPRAIKVNNNVKLFRSRKLGSLMKDYRDREIPAIDSYNLGRMYQYGYGVKQDIEEAKRWYQIAANKGEARANNKLKEIE